MYDIVIIGAGVSGAATARELSRYQAHICVVEKEEDVCCGTSKANSAIVHAGFDADTGTLMARLNVEGNRMMDDLCRDLDIPFKRNGSLVACTDEERIPDLYKLYERGLENGVEELKVITDREELRVLEPNLSDQVVAALYAPTGGIICPFTLNTAMAENACVNGVEFRFDTEVTTIEKREGGGFLIHTGKGDIETRCIVNAAGVYSGKFHNMFAKNPMTIVPRRGDYCLLDKTCGSHVSHTIFELPGKMGKGVLVSPTVHGNLIIGPTAIDIDNKEGTNTTQVGLNEVIEKSSRTVKNIPIRQVITSFAGLRAHEAGHEFIIGELPEAPGFFDCAGIESPGLTSSPAIGKMLAGLIRDKLGLKDKTDFIPTRKGIIKPNSLPLEAHNSLIRENPAYGNIICRCEMITEGEIIDAIHRPLGARSLDGVKRRVRAGHGRCQGGFCSPRVIDILARELKLQPSDITKAGGSSKIVLGRNKDRI